MAGLTYRMYLCCRYETYGPGKEGIPLALRLGAVTALTAGLSLAPRMGAGSRYKEAKKPENMQPVKVWAYEVSACNFGFAF